MLETMLRPLCQKILVDPPAKLIVKYVSPNTATLLGVLFGIAASVFYLERLPLWSVFLLLLSGYFDTLDGTLARFCHVRSHYGAALDIFADRIVEFAIILALFLYAPAERGLETFCMLGSVLLCITAFLVATIFYTSQQQQLPALPHVKVQQVDKKIVKKFRYSWGLMERAEAFCFFIAMMLLPQWFDYLAWTFVVLVSWTAIWHIIQCIRYSHSTLATPKT